MSSPSMCFTVDLKSPFDKWYRVGKLTFSEHIIWLNNIDYFNSTFYLLFFLQEATLCTLKDNLNLSQREAVQ